MYRAPVADIAFTLRKIAGLEDAIESGVLGDLSDDLVDAILQEAGRFASDEMAPLAEAGDRHGTPLADGVVTMPPGWKQLYADWIAGGWNALGGPEAFGGQDLPTMLSVATAEMWNASNMAFGLGPLLTMGAIEAIDKHGDDALKARYLEKLVSGEWMGTMNLTEPQAGSDLNALKTRAEPRGDGAYRIFGQKIYITYGEHDLTDNIVHLVLARLPDAPAGTRGISLFAVPKFLVGDDGALGARNDVFCSGVEHKLGIHGSPTCTMIYGDGKFGDEAGAIGWLVGEENRGLACMFTMMNNARLNVGIQGVAVADAAYQKALAYAGERAQGKAAGHDGKGMSPIIEHPDVQRNLLTMRALTEAARAICYACAHAIDMARAAGDADTARDWQERANLLTPVAKAFSTDIGCEVASIGVQVHGGMGYVEETGAARFMRDARIAPIYEGTNGIQAIDLVQRKLPLSGGRQVAGYIAELRAIAEDVSRSNREGFGRTGARLDQAVDDLDEATRWLSAAMADGRQQEALAGAQPYLRLFGLVAGTVYLAKGALLAEDDAPARTAMARFAAENLLGEASALRERVTEGADSLLAARAALTA
ncbi:acyl-CoA dehydrogenase [Pararhizobium haloflavum]|uniref:acyl-CoA dehydrogenase n=1 Tax=Pararhizobium haloflavum TaxID=2037914 RepID=UPI000C18DFA5|nr:acyl-CoA dehydrogenase [Pararhizobium haloflavum]